MTTTTDSRYLAQDEGALRDAALLSVEHARRLGADASSARTTTGGGLRIVVRDGVAETAQRDGFQSLDCTVYRGRRRGSASTVALDPASIRRATEEAMTIASHVQPEDVAGLADPDMLAHAVPRPPTFAPSDDGPDRMLDTAASIEVAVLDHARSTGRTIRVAEAGVATADTAFALATSAGFCRSAAGSTHGRWAIVLCDGADGTVRDYEQSSERRTCALMPVPALAERAVARTAALVGARTLSSRRAPVLFDARVASAIVSDIVGALSGGSQYRRASFLLDTLDTRVAADHLALEEDPFLPYGMASGAFDGEGVAGSRRRVLADGVVGGYFLTSESARRLGRRSTGNAGGPWNLRFSSRLAGADADAMRAIMGTGLIVTRINGGATDPVTGNWTRAVTGLWVEDGAIAYPVQDVTVGGRMDAMLNGIVGIGDDIHRSGAITTGSILIDAMQIGGTA